MCGHIHPFHISRIMNTHTHMQCSTQNVHANSLNEKNLRNLFKLALCKYIIFKPYIPQYCTVLCCTHSVRWMKKKERARVWLLLKRNSFVSINQIWAKQINNEKMVHIASENFVPWIRFFLHFFLFRLHMRLIWMHCNIYTYIFVPCLSLSFSSNKLCWSYPFDVLNVMIFILYQGENNRLDSKRLYSIQNLDVAKCGTRLHLSPISSCLKMSEFIVQI